MQSALPEKTDIVHNLQVKKTPSFKYPHVCIQYAKNDFLK